MYPEALVCRGIYDCIRHESQNVAEITCSYTNLRELSDVLSDLWPETVEALLGLCGVLLAPLKLAIQRHLYNKNLLIY